MNRFVLLSFLVMGWGYYELSGGADFVPEERPVQVAAPAPAALSAEDPAASAATEPQAESDPLDAVTVVTRARTDDLDTLPEADSIVDDAIALDATSVADALAQALGDPVIVTAGPEPLPDPADTVLAALSADDPAQPDPTVAADLREVTGDTVNLREGPGTTFTVLDRLTRGTVVSLLDTGPEGWVYVEANGRTGWMSADFIGPQI